MYFPVFQGKKCLGGLIRRQETDCHLFSLCSLPLKKVLSSCCRTIISTIQILIDENWNGSSMWKLQFFLNRENTCLNCRDCTEKSVVCSGECGDFSHAMQCCRFAGSEITHTFSFTFSNEHSFQRNSLFNFVFPLDAGLAQAAAFPLCLYCLSYVEANWSFETSTKRRLWSLLAGDGVNLLPSVSASMSLSRPGKREQPRWW